MASRFEAELAVATEAAREAGRVMEEYRADGVSVERKETYTDLVTDADREAQRTIIERIRDEFPGDGIKAEEDDVRPDGEDRVWVIDPIDGTTNFAHGLPFYCTSIGLRVEGERTVGAVYAPPQDELFTAVQGSGAELNGEPITVSATDALEDALVITRVSGRFDGETYRDMEIAFLRDLLQQPSSFRRPGVAALDLCMVAAGRADGYAVISLSEWDIAAAALILEEAGGAARIQESCVDGYLEIVGSNGRIQDDLTEVFDRHVER